MINLEKKLTAIAKRMNVNFTLKSSVASYKEVFSDTGLLPGLTKRADQLAQFYKDLIEQARKNNEEKKTVDSSAGVRPEAVWKK